MPTALKSGALLSERHSRIEGRRRFGGGAGIRGLGI